MLFIGLKKAREKKTYCFKLNENQIKKKANTIQKEKIEKRELVLGQEKYRRNEKIK